MIDCLSPCKVVRVAAGGSRVLVEAEGGRHGPPEGGERAERRRPRLVDGRRRLVATPALAVRHLGCGRTGSSGRITLHCA